MTQIEMLIAQVYSAFNSRDTDGALALMSATVNWPKASEGGRVSGKEEIRAYWSRQWKEFDPHVQPIEVRQKDAIKVHVRVHQTVKDLTGQVLFDGEVWHIYSIANGLIERMDLGESGAESQSEPSSAFAPSKS